MSPFVRAMLWREVRASWRRLLLFVLCIAAGVGGLVAVKAFSHNVEQGIAGEARTLMAADLVVRSRRPPTAEETAALAELQAQGAQVVHSLQFVSMARSGASPRVQVVSARAVGAGYPFYGEVLTGSGQPLDALLSDDTVLVHNALLLKMGLAVGDPLQLGRRTFRIAGVLVKEPDSPVQVFNLGPRVLMTEAAGRATGLVPPTSRVRYAALVRVPPGHEPAAVAEALRQRLPDTFARIDTYDKAQPRVTRFLGRLTDFLNLVGLAALLLGGIGVAGAIRVFIAQKMDTLAVLKCVGATSRELLAVYLLLAVLLGLIGSSIGAALGLGAQLALPRLLGDLLPVSLELTWPWTAIAEGALLGTVTTLWFALPPLLTLRRIPPARVFRRQVEASHPGRRPWVAVAQAGAAMLVLAALLAVWQAGFTKVAGIFLLGLGGAAVALYLSAAALLWVLRRLPKPASFELKQGLSSLYRPGNQTGAVVMSVGLGVLLLLAVFLIQSDLLRQLVTHAPQHQPNLFFIDIQPGQREVFRRVLAEHGQDEPELIPIVRGRVVGLRGKPLRLSEVQDDHQRRHLRFEYAFTYRGALVPGEEVAAGRFAHDPAVAGPQVSLADWFAEDTGLRVGDTGHRGRAGRAGAGHGDQCAQGGLGQSPRQLLVRVSARGAGGGAQDVRVLPAHGGRGGPGRPAARGGDRTAQRHRAGRGDDLPHRAGLHGPHRRGDPVHGRVLHRGGPGDPAGRHRHHQVPAHPRGGAAEDPGRHPRRGGPRAGRGVPAAGRAGRCRGRGGGGRLLLGPRHLCVRRALGSVRAALPRGVARHGRGHRRDRPGEQPGRAGAKTAGGAARGIAPGRKPRRAAGCGRAPYELPRVLYQTSAYTSATAATQAMPK